MMIDAPIPGPVAEPDPREPAIEPDEKITVLLRSMTLESGAKVAVGTAEGREETFFRFSNRDGVETKFCLSPEAVDALRDLLGQKRGGSVSGAELMWRLVEHVASQSKAGEGSSREGTMSGHTLAPWHLVPIANSPAPEQHFSVQSVDIDAGDYVADVWCEANARLIAAAPQLLAALRAFVSLDDGDEPFAWTNSMVFDQARAAIAKAEGK